jgi:hypothetical protein
VLTYQVGVAGASAKTGEAMAEYLTKETLTTERTEMARYYAGEAMPEPASLVEELGQALNRGDMEYGDAMNALVEAELAAVPPGQHANIEAIEQRASDDLMQAATRADFAEAVADAGGTVAALRPDLSPEMAERLGIADPRRPLTEENLAHLLNGKRLDGNPIEGKKLHSATRSLADIFTLDPKVPVTGDALQNVLAGRRSDGSALLDTRGRALNPEAVDKHLRRFRPALRLSPRRDATPEEMANLLAGKNANGKDLDLNAYGQVVNGTRPPIAYIDLTWSAPMGLSVAWGLAPTEAERAAILDVHRHAVADAMAYVETVLGNARIGAGGQQGSEKGTLAWVTFSHYTARPAVDIALLDKEGLAYTARKEVPLATADPQLHSHVIVPNVVLTPAGRVGSLNLDLLAGRQKEFGAVYQGYVSRHAKTLGIEVDLGKSGEAMIQGVPDTVVRQFSKRANEGQRRAEEYARAKGFDWNELSGEQQVARLKAAAAEARNPKNSKEGHRPDFDVWREQAEAAGYRHRSVLQPGTVQPELSDERRAAVAYEKAIERPEERFKNAATLDGAELRVEAARGFIVAGISDNPADDIAAVSALYRRAGVRLHGEQTAITETQLAPDRGRSRTVVTTALQAEMETDIIAMATTAAADKSAALTVAQIDRAATEFLARNPRIDPASAQWQSQKEMMLGLATQGRISVGIGAAGSGKSALLEPLVAAWRADGRHVYGTALGWRQTTALGKAGIGTEDRAALDPFLRRAAKGKYVLNSRSVIVVDEVAVLGVKQMRDLLRLQQQTGAQIATIGDPAQMNSIEAGAVVPLLQKAIGGKAIEILTSIRQRTQRELDITAKLRNEATIPDALAMKRADGDLQLVAGGPDATIRHAAKLYAQRVAAHRDDPTYTQTIITMNNAQTAAVGKAVRTELQAAGSVGPDVMTIKAVARGETFDLTLGVNDQVRLFDRVHDADKPGRSKVLASNGDTVTVLALSERGMHVRNEAGVEGMVEWRKLRQHPDAPVNLALGYARTVNVEQGSTVTESLFVLPNGTSMATAFAAYVAGSRHEQRSTWVIDEASVRRSISATQPRGIYQPIREPDILTRIADDLSRKPEKENAIEMLRNAAQVRRGTVRQFQRGMTAAARVGQGHPAQHHYREQRRLHQAMRRGLDYTREITERTVEAVRDLAQHLHRHEQRRDRDDRHDFGLSR